MSISFSGLASGLDTSSWVEALVSVKQGKVDAVKKELQGIKAIKSTLDDTKSVFSALRSSIEKFTDAKFGGTFDLFSKNVANSSNENVVTAKVVSGAHQQSLRVNVKQLATFTKATSKESASSIADDSTKLKSLGVTDGELTAYVNGKKSVININSNDTVGDMKSKFADAGIDMNINEDGSVVFTAQNGVDDINIGSTTDTTNLMSLVGLTKQKDGSYISSNSLYKATLDTKLVDEDAGFKDIIKEGTFTIGSATFTIDKDTTLTDLISKINSNEKAQVNAYWDDTTGKLSLTSKKEGASYINIEAGTSNFTDVMGFTTSEWNEDGELVSTKMFTDAQEIGQNAIFTLNGTTMTSTSNVVTSDISRIEGLTLTLNDVSTEENGDAIIDITQDTSDLVEAVKSFVSAYNNVMLKVGEVTANGASLHGETSLTSMKNTLRSYISTPNSQGEYKMLSELGISTGKADASNLNTDTNLLQFDESAFMKALEENPESVRQMLTSETGIFGMMESAVEQSLSASSGFFDIKTATLNSDIKKLETKITKQNKSIQTYKSQLEDKFYKMELAISQMQQNYSSFMSQ